MYRFLLRAALLLLSMQLCAQTHSPPRAAWSVRWEPAGLVNGSPVLFRVTAPAQVKALEGTWFGHNLSFRFARECSCWYAIAGVGLDAHPGKYALELHDPANPAGQALFTYDVPVGEAHYPTAELKIPPEYVEPPKEVEARIIQEEAIKKNAFAATSNESLWWGSFRPPTTGAISSIFGSARLLNGVKRSQHKGLDFRAHTGTPIHAANRGTVILARSLYYEGNCVALDHGQGLMTIYMHLSKLKVKEGEKVETGQLIGLSGGTGRATAPHLHFAVRWEGEYLDPRTLLALHPPARVAKKKSAARAALSQKP